MLHDGLVSLVKRAFYRFYFFLQLRKRTVLSLIEFSQKFAKLNNSIFMSLITNNLTYNTVSLRDIRLYSMPLCLSLLENEFQFLYSK